MAPIHHPDADAAPVARLRCAPADALRAPAVRADETPSAWDRTLSALNSTTFPLGLDGEQDEGWFTGAWDG